MNDYNPEARMWDSTVKRHHAQAVRRLRDAQERIGYMLRVLEQVDPTDLHGSVVTPSSSDAQNLVADLVEVKGRLDMLDLLRDFQPVFRPVIEVARD